MAISTQDHGVAVNTGHGGSAVSAGDYGVAVSTAVRNTTTPPTPADPATPKLPFEIVESAFKVAMDGKSHTFAGRSKKLFALLVRITRRPGHRVQFDSLRLKGDVWDGYDVEDSTIRGAIKRLKDQLRQAKLTALAGAISTGTFENRQYVILNLEGLAAKSN